jgi:hypothetical protein
MELGWRIVAGLGRVLLSVALIFAWVAPVVLAKLFADTLDILPYIDCLMIGVVGATIACVLFWPLVRAGLSSTGTASPLGLVLAAAIAFAPTWSIGIGLGLNQVFDGSPIVPHECRVIGWKVPAKTRAYCIVTSWRGKKSEKLADSFVLESEPGEGGAPESGAVSLHAENGPQMVRFPSKCTPGATVVVYTRSGRLGWERIIEVRRQP